MLGLSIPKMYCSVALWQVPNSLDKLHSVILDVSSFGTEEPLMDCNSFSYCSILSLEEIQSKYN